ncbi:DoxX family protein [Roseateles saccharophilus]|uniref:Putative oxidoreductase n=1 Tax=Roseateles saccharophilus TaxID=304 RepID=A0A4R3VCA1_ROSSA|nr:DoxX family protein [Roseateles saccharophilus]MDG0831720.1 DoxX family protein [Roseateles saccharophilus]TCV01262.1 putative oxidoreductase [Roseateles saccharophilus]
MTNLTDKLAPWSDLLGRVLMAAIFVTAGAGKIGGYAATQGYMASMGVPGGLLPLVILTELGGGLLIVLGLFTRPAAFALAGFSVVSALLFHGNLADQGQQIHFMKNLAMAGGFLLLVGHGAGPLSLDAKWRGRA